MAGVAEPALFLGVGVTAALADEEAAFQALPSAVHEEPVGLQAAGTVGPIQVLCVGKQLPLGTFLLNLAPQLPWKNMDTRNKQTSCFCNRFRCMKKTVTQSWSKAPTPPWPPCVTTVPTPHPTLPLAGRPIGWAQFW